MAFSSVGVRRLLGATGVLVVLDLLALGAPVAAQDRLTVDTSASASVATNPFLLPGSTSVVVGPTLSVSPVWTSERPLTTLRLEGNATATFYNRGYGTNDSFSVRGFGSHRLSETTTLNGALGYTNSIAGSFNNVQVPVGVVPPVGSELPGFVTDPALVGIGQRQKAYQVSSSLVSILSPRDQIQAGFDVSANRSSGVGLQDFNYANPSVSYSRAIGENFTVGGSFAVGFSRYLHSTSGNATVYQPALTLSRTIGERWALNASLGAAIVNLTEEPDQNRTTTTFNGSVNLCRRDARWTACFNAARQTVPSAFQGIRTSTIAGTSLGYRINPADTLSITGNYSHSSAPLQSNIVNTARNDEVDFASITGNYSHRFRQNLSGFVAGGYAKSFGDGLRRNANVTATAGVTYRFNGR